MHLSLITRISPYRLRDWYSCWESQYFPIKGRLLPFDSALHNLVLRNSDSHWADMSIQKAALIYGEMLGLFYEEGKLGEFLQVLIPPGYKSMVEMPQYHKNWNCWVFSPILLQESVLTEKLLFLMQNFFKVTKKYWWKFANLLMVKIRTIHNVGSEHGYLHGHTEQGMFYFYSDCTKSKRAIRVYSTEVERQARDDTASFYLHIFSPSYMHVCYGVTCKQHPTPSVWLEHRPPQQKPVWISVSWVVNRSCCHELFRLYTSPIKTFCSESSSSSATNLYPC